MKAAKKDFNPNKGFVSPEMERFIKKRKKINNKMAKECQKKCQANLGRKK